MNFEAYRYRGVLLALLLALLWLVMLPSLASAQLMTEAQLAEIPGGDQPIKFSHKIHAGDNQIPCQYCHIYARRSQVAGAPPVQLCMGCHKLVGTQLSEIKKLTKFWNDKQPIPWVKIHDVPDFVRFVHSKHVNAKNEVFPQGVPCQQCHGPVETMHVVKKQDEDFGNMGWCLECHLTVPGALERKRTVAASKDGVKLLNALRPDGTHRPNLTDCMTCHK